MKTLIVGAGEIGMSVYRLLEPHYEIKVIDKDNDIGDFEVEIMHICFPYSDDFMDAVNGYQKKYKPDYTIIHSTVPVGTSRKLFAIHSPCVGIHPHLQQSLLTFTKFLGGEQVGEVAQYFRRAGVKVYLTDNPESTELMKILSTSFYGLCIEWNKEVKLQCAKYEVPFELWTLWTNNYNQGYRQLGYPEYCRPNLIPMKQKIGGHCVLPNLQFLDSKFSEFIKKQNE